MSGQEGVGFAALWKTKRYLECIERLRRGNQNALVRLWRLESAYFDDLHRLQRSPLHNPKHTIYHTRIDRGRRLIDEPLSGAYANEVALHYAGAHDDANAFGATYRADTTVALAASIRVGKESEPDPQPVERPHRGIPGTYGETLSPALLRECGVPEDQVEMVLATHTAVSLVDIGITPEVEDRVINAFFSLAPSAPVRRPVPGGAQPDALRVGASELLTLLRMPLHLFLSQLSPAQQALAERSAESLTIVRGAAGSGKTIVAVRRAEWLLKRRPLGDSRPVLLVCHNRVLAHAVEQMLTDVLGADLAAAGVEVRTIYSLLTRELMARGQPAPRILADAELTRYLRAAASDAKVDIAETGVSEERLKLEIQEVIYGRALEQESDYLSADREGMGIPLAESQRRRVWAVFSAMDRRLRAAGSAMWESLPAGLLRIMPTGTGSVPRYYGVVVDEAQDLTPASFRVLLGLQAGSSDRLMVLGDAMQAIYRRGFRWKYTGLVARGGQFQTLSQCFRSTPAIVATVRPLAMAEQAASTDVSIAAAAGDPGPNVTLARYASETAQADDVVSRIVQMICEGEPASAIAVIMHSSQGRQLVRKRLLDAGVAVEDQDDDGRRSLNIFDASVKLVSPPSAKGMEFPNVFLLDVTKRWYPADGESDDTPAAEDVGRRALYMAMLRAGYHLHVGTIAGRESPHLASLSRAYLEEIA